MSTVDVTNPAAPKYLAHMPPTGDEANGTQHVQVCDGRELAHGDAAKVYAIRTNGMLGYEVDCDPAHTLVLSTDRLGVRAMAQTIVRPGPSPDKSNVVYSFFIALSGLPSLLLSERSLREKQDHMIDVTLVDIERAFAKPAAAPAP